MNIPSRFITQAPSYANPASLFYWWMPAARDGDPDAIRAFSASDLRPPQAARTVGREGRLDGMSVLELGPWEANQTVAIEALGADILSIEGNAEAFLKCLIVKEALNLKTRFMLGNFIPYLEDGAAPFDLIYASGVLYHMTDPFRLLRAISRRTDRLFLWTHYFEPSNDQNRQPMTVTREGLELTYYVASNAGREENVKWMGGLEDTAAWMSPDDIRRVLRHVGFDRIEEIADVPAGPESPAHFTLSCRKD